MKPIATFFYALIIIINDSLIAIKCLFKFFFLGRISDFHENPKFFTRWMEIRYFWAYLYDTYFINSQDQNNARFKQNLDEQLRHKLLAIFPEPLTSQPIPIYQKEEINSEKVAELLKKREPFIIKNYYSDSEAVKKWDLDFFVEKYGDVPVWAGDPNEGKHSLQPLKNIRQSDTYARNIESLFQHAPELIKDIDLERLNTQGLDKDRWLHSIQLFIADSIEARSAYHCAKMDNCFIMVHGRKKWWFINPVYTHIMKPYFNKGMGYYESRIGNPEEPNPDFPLYQHIPRMEGEIEAGDLLFSPPLWWHAVSNTTTDNIAISTRLYSADVETYYPLSLLQVFCTRFMSIKIRTVEDLFYHLKKYGFNSNYHPDKNFVSRYDPETKYSLFEEASHQIDYQHSTEKR